ncbi:glycoside hydrolase family 3 protein [Faecalimonas umbilicata]|uniref:glycoside hydrolase family 3 protein n=1 Tax=Faecalimonas umbilicata TaxID=1912855 RepID=UPI002A7F6211|nr:glycoside hydrolase family 3 N-terminal domain-containing protein [Faecalimonas umbilicata]MDY4596661.1 glycoside hydrolase family 3 N-terminal domain-containing protein [Faecalimonas umbilicata]
MVDLKSRPYYLSEEDCQWVKDTIANMSPEEKVGQLFFQLTASHDEEYLKELMEKYHLGGCRYNPAPGKAIQEQNRILQKYAKVPVFIACNTEAGGDGACADGTHIGAGVKIAATDKEEYAFALGKMANEQAAAIGCNMAFAPVADILYNWENTEIVTRAFGGDAERVATMSKAYLNGAHTIPGFACAAKHFPGNGQDFRDAHIANNVNYFDVEKWDETYGHVYRTLIENDLDAIMGGHIMLPSYAKAINPELKDEDMMPATLSPEIMTGLLRDRLGFNGMVVTDASHMVAMTDRMKRSEMLPASINAGCDMFLFFNDPEEDFATMLGAYKTGIISEERMTEALTRILGLKAHLGLNKKSKEELVPQPETVEEVLQREEYKAMQKSISEDCITLVKYKDKDVLPMTPDRYKRIMIVHIKGAENSMSALMKMLGGGKGNPAEALKEKLCAKGFDAFIYESPLDIMKKQIEAGEKPDLNIYFAGKNAIADFVSDMDLVITLCDVPNGRPSFGMSKGGGEIPWYVFEVPVVVVGCGQPTMLADIPQARTYINTYDSKDTTLDALVENLMNGEEAFKGTDPIDSFCGLFDARL